MKNNPYQSPASDVLTDKNELTAKKSSFGWKVYFWLNAILLTITLIVFPLAIMGLMDAEFSIYDGVDFIVWVPSLLALFGMAWARKTLNRKFWAIYMYVFLAWNLFYSFIYTFVLGMKTYGSVTTIEDLVFDLPFLFLQVYVLYRYVYKMDSLWVNHDRKKYRR